MSWAEKLKLIFNLNYCNFSLITINKTHHDNKKEYIIKDERTLEIILDNLDSNKKEKIKEIVIDYYNDDNLVLESKTSQILETLYQYRQKKDDEKILNFFKTIINSEDYCALEASLFLRSEFNKERDIKELKKSIYKNFGIRGTNISNFCTSGYFDDFFIELYNAYQDKQKFLDLFDNIVSRSLVAIFVHKNMSQTEIKKQIIEKIESSKKYGIKFIHLHGIGHQNINTIKNILIENKENLNYTSKTEFENKERGILVVSLYI